MKAIIIEDKDCRALVEKLSLVNVSEQVRRSHATQDCSDVQIDAMHRLFHYEVVRWLQDQGAQITQ